MSDDNLVDRLAAWRRQLPPGSGGESPGGRITRLEEWAKQADARLVRIEDKLDAVLQRLAGAPTRGDLITYATAVLAIMMAVLGLFIAGMGWLETRSARLSPSISTSSAPETASRPAAGK